MRTDNTQEPTINIRTTTLVIEQGNELEEIDILTLPPQIRTQPLPSTVTELLEELKKYDDPDKFDCLKQAYQNQTSPISPELNHAFQEITKSRKELLQLSKAFDDQQRIYQTQIKLIAGTTPPTSRSILNGRQYEEIVSGKTLGLKPN